MRFSHEITDQDAASMAEDAKKQSTAEAKESSGESQLLAALTRIQHIVHQKTAKTEPAIHHWQRDFDEIRTICERMVGPYKEEKSGDG